MALVKTVGIVSKPAIRRAAEIVPALVEWLRARSVEVRYDLQTAHYLEKDDGLRREDVPDECGLLIVLGGDGTLLSAARAIGGREIPLFAVNLGGLGFLTAITLDELYPELERALRREHRISHRKLLCCELWRNSSRVGEYDALNDVVVTKASMARMIEVECFVDDNFVCTYRADGLIIATPTGSTAYSLSAGGPIVFPGVEALCITPICPHMLTNRPVLVPENSCIQVTSRAESESSYLTIDGQIGVPLDYGDRVVCRSSCKTVQLVLPPRMMFFDVLREKLSWGER